MMDKSDRGFVCRSSVAKMVSNSSICQLNESVYELHRPKGKPSMQILFFHDLQFSDCKDPHLSTWKSKDGSQIWPQTWLVKKFPGAHVLSISYDARVVMGDGNLELHIIAENMASDLLGANIGQEPRCPVVLVGHGFGGLVIKQLCLHAHKRVDSRSWRSSELQKFLQNVKGVFYYGTPHGGIPINILPYFEREGPLLQFVKTLSTHSTRLDADFNDLIDGYKDPWRIAGVGESLPTEGGQFSGRVVVPEASARHRGNFNVAEGTDHISVCKPESEISRSFYALTELLDTIACDSKVNLPVHECQGLPDYPVKLEERARKIQEILTDAPVLGIVGMGGIGKTTLAKQVFNNISIDFEYTCFVSDVKEIQIHLLEDWLLSKFHHSGSRIDKPSWSDLNGKKVLIVMDDADSEKPFKVMPKLHHFAKGSRVIITTRDRSVLKVYGTYVCHEVQLLEEDDAMKLFYQHAFRIDEDEATELSTNHALWPGKIWKYAPSPEFIRERVVRKCDGLPLTLEVLGRHFCGREYDATFWEETIDTLGKAQAISGDRDDRAWAVLRVSVDALTPEVQEMFVSAATFFFEQPLQRALAAWSTTCGNSQIGWTNLVSRSLVKEVYKEVYNGDGWDNDKTVCKTVWVHEHLRDLAKTLPLGNMLYAPEKQSAVKLVEVLNSRQVDAERRFLDLSHRLPRDPLGLGETEQRSLCCGVRIVFGPQGREFGEVKVEQRTLRFRSLLHLKQLKYMDLTGVILKGYPRKLPRKLSLLHWEDTSKLGREFPVSCIEEMENLAILELQNFQTSRAFPEALGKLTNLRILCLRSIRGSRSPMSMKEADILPKNWGRLSQLKRLELVDFKVSKLPESFGSLSRLEDLVFEDVELTELPESFGNLSSLVKLTFRRCNKLKTLPMSFGFLHALEELTLGVTRDDQGRLESLPDTFGHLGALKKLTMYQKKLRFLPSSCGLLTSLQILKIMGEALETLPFSIGQLQDLKKLTIWGKNLHSFPPSFWRLTSLQELEIWSPALKMLPENLGQLSSLQKLVLFIYNVKILPDSVGQLCSLRKFRLYCDLAERLPETLGQLTSLQELALCLPSLENLPDTFGRLWALKELEMDQTRLRCLPSSCGHLTSLQMLDIGGEALETLPSSIGQLQALKKVIIQGQNFHSLPPRFCFLTSLQFLLISSRALKTLPENLGQLTSLEVLHLEVPSLTVLPETLGQLSSLQELYLDCASMKVLAESVLQLSSLHTLTFRSAFTHQIPREFALQLLESTKRRVSISRIPEISLIPESSVDDSSPGYPPRIDFWLQTRTGKLIVWLLLKIVNFSLKTRTKKLIVWFLLYCFVYYIVSSNNNRFVNLLVLFIAVHSFITPRVLILVSRISSFLAS